MDAVVMAVDAQFASMSQDNAEKIAATEAQLAEAEREMAELDKRRQELRTTINDLRAQLKQWQGDAEERERTIRKMLSLLLTGKVSRAGRGEGRAGSGQGGGFPYRVFVNGKESSRGPARGRIGDFLWQHTKGCGGSGQEGRFLASEWYQFLEDNGQKWGEPTVEVTLPNGVRLRLERIEENVRV